MHKKSVRNSLSIEVPIVKRAEHASHACIQYKVRRRRLRRLLLGGGTVYRSQTRPEDFGFVLVAGSVQHMYSYSYSHSIIWGRARRGHRSARSDYTAARD